MTMAYCNVLEIAFNYELCNIFAVTRALSIMCVIHKQF